MSIRVGDAVFIRSGQPGVVRDRDPISGDLRLETGLKNVQKDMRHGYLNGLSQQERTDLNEILDEVKGGTEDPHERVDLLTNKIQELEQNPAQHILTRYLRSELTHILNTNGIEPRYYNVNETKTR